MLKLMFNKGFAWNEIQDIHYKGFISIGDQKIDADSIFAILKGIDTYAAFFETIKTFMGCFAIAMEKHGETWIAVDLARSIPMFISCDGQFVSDSAEEIRRDMGIHIHDVEDVFLAEMLLTTNTSNGHTVYREILQCDLGQTAQIKNGRVSFDYYYRHVNFQKVNQSKDEWLEELSQITDRISERLVSSLDRKTAVVPLSGGYDSRYVVSMLKKKGYQDVICYAYGNREDYDVMYSKKIAESLEYKWYFVEYSKEKWDKFFDERNSGVDEYFKDIHNHCSLPHIQDYIALSILIKEGKIPPDSVVIPGFGGDIPAGAIIPKESEVKNLDPFEISKWIYHQHFINTTVSKKVKDEVIQNIQRYITGLKEEISSFTDFASVYDAWFTGYRSSMYIINSNRVSEHFGLQWRLPLWDKEFLDFWYRMPVRYRHGCSLYIEWLFSNLFEPFGIALIKPVPSPIIHENTSPVKKYLIGKIKKILIYFSMNLGKPIYNRNNANNFNYAAILFFKKIQYKKPFHYNYVSVLQVQQLWWCEKMYGVENIRRITTETIDQEKIEGPLKA